MDAPPIQYARTDDGVNIAYTVCGEGPPLVYLQPFTHQQLDWTVPELRSWFEKLAATHRVIRFDLRRFGLSTRSTDAMSLETFGADLRAVVDHLGLERFDVMGISGQTLTAIRYAVDFPTRVRRLVLWSAAASGAAFSQASPRMRALVAVWDIDPELAREVMVRAVFGEDAMLRPECVAHAKEAAATADLRAYSDAVLEADATDALPRIACPTLLVYPRGPSYSDLGAHQAVAAAIPDCELFYADAEIYPHRGGGSEVALGKLNEFLRTEAEDGGRAASMEGFRTLMFTDLESSTAMTEAVGDARAQEVVRGHNAAVRAALAAHGGEEVKHTGDGIMAAFGSAVSAVEAALQIQRELAGAEVRVRVGLNAGEPIHEDDDYFGSAVQLAARVCDRAEPGQVVVTQVVRDLVRGKGFRFDDLGAVTLKGFPEPERLFVVGEAQR